MDKLNLYLDCMHLFLKIHVLLIPACLLDCLNGACVFTPSGPVCQCYVGFTGNTCQTEINECQSDPCFHGNCTDLINGYNCSCLAGYTGQNCETDIDECASQPCAHICTDLLNNFTCSCFQGFRGDLCDGKYVLTYGLDQTVKYAMLC